MTQSSCADCKIKNWVIMWEVQLSDLLIDSHCIQLSSSRTLWRTCWRRGQICIGLCCSLIAGAGCYSGHMDPDNVFRILPEPWGMGHRSTLLMYSSDPKYRSMIKVWLFFSFSRLRTTAITLAYNGVNIAYPIRCLINHFKTGVEWIHITSSSGYI